MQASIRDAVAERPGQHAGALKLGNGLEAGINMGPPIENSAAVKAEADRSGVRSISPVQ